MASGHALTDQANFVPTSIRHTLIGIEPHSSTEIVVGHLDLYFIIVVVECMYIPIARFHEGGGQRSKLLYS